VRIALRWKLCAAVLAIAVSIIAVVFAISELTFTRGFQNIEDQQASDMARMAANALGERVKSLDTLNRDWAAWDDTYAFVLDPEQHESFVRDNPIDSAFVAGGFSFLLIVNNDGQIVFSKGVNLSDGAAMEVPGTLVSSLPGSTLGHHSTTEDGIAGVVLLPEGPLLLSSRPIITSRFEGPVAGTIIMANLVDPALISELQDRLRVPLSAVSVQEARAELEAPSWPGTDPTRTTYRIVDAKTMSGYAVVDDVDGAPALVLKATVPRQIYAQSTAISRYFLVSLVGVGALFVLTFTIVLSRMITSRVGRVGAYAGAIAENIDLPEQLRLPVKGRDELAQLSSDVNRVVEALQSSRAELRAKEETERALRLVIDALAHGTAVTDLTGTITDISSSQMLSYGYDGAGELVGMKFLDLVAGPDRMQARDNMEMALQTGCGSGGEYAMVRKNGTTFRAHFYAAVSRDADGQPVSFALAVKPVREHSPAGSYAAPVAAQTV
jgi:PAS domain S-box-containing protein